MNSKIEKYKGLVYGVALGDAYGMATEMLDRDTIISHNLDISEPIASLDISIISKNRPAYSITDDTMNTLMILDMLKSSNNKINTKLYIKKLQDWSNNSPIAGYVTGPSTSRALKEINEGKSVDESGIFGTTNGAAMKIGPVGLISDYKDIDLLVQNVVSLCKPTHNTRIALSGASAIASAVSYFYQGGESIDEMYEVVYKSIKAAKDYGFNWPSASLEFRIKSAKNIVENNTEDVALEKLYNEIGCSVETIDTVPVALSLVALSDGNSIDCAKLAARIGGDTDTIGAISVGICGVYKPDTIPLDMIKKIEKVNNFCFDDYF